MDHARRAEVSAGIIAALLYNSHVSREYEAKSASHFMQDWGKEYRPVDPTEIPEAEPVENKVDAIFTAMMQRGTQWQSER